MQTFRSRPDGSIGVHMAGWERELVRQVTSDLRALLADEDPSSDAAVARLYPPAFPDDPLRNLDFERVAMPVLAEGRDEAIDTVRRTLDAETLTPEELHAWMRVANDVRLVLGTRLDVTEESEPEDFEGEDERARAFAIYSYLSMLVERIVDVLPVA